MLRRLNDIYKETEADGQTNLFCLYADHNPLNFQETVEKEICRSAMGEEIHIIQRNETWELVPLPLGHQLVSNECIRSSEQLMEKLIGTRQLVAKGYKQKYGIEYGEVLLLIPRLDTVRIPDFTLRIS